MPPDSDAIVANAHWEACEACKHGGRLGCDINSDDFKYEAALYAFVCENYERGMDKDG